MNVNSYVEGRLLFALEIALLEEGVFNETVNKALKDGLKIQVVGVQEMDDSI